MKHVNPDSPFKGLDQMVNELGELLSGVTDCRARGLQAFLKKSKVGAKLSEPIRFDAPCLSPLALHYFSADERLGQRCLGLHSRTLRQVVHVALVAACTALGAQERPMQAPQQITITGTPRQVVEKSYRKMVQGMDYFERARAAIAPDASLRFKLLPRKPGTDMDRIVLEVIGSSFDYAVPIAPDHTFVLERDVKAMEEDAVVSPNRKRLSMTWRTEIRTPGLPADIRRLGDLRLECEVGLEAGLVSNSSPIGRFFDLFTDSKGYCDRKETMYMYFAERPLFSVTLVAGARREVLPIDRLYAMASDDPGLKADLPYCDCEMLVDRTYFLPLGDHSWPDDTRIEFEYMDDRP